MSVRIGWGFSRPKDRKPHELGGRAKLFSFVRVKDSSVRQIVVGAVSYRRDELEHLRAKGQKLDTTVTGLARFAPDISPELAQATIAKLKVAGWLHAASDLKRAIQRG